MTVSLHRRPKRGGMSIAALVHRHVFGAKTDVNCGIGYVDDQNVAFTAGHSIVLHNLEQKTQKFMPGTENTEDIVAMCISPNRKFLAVSESSDKATVTVFDCIGLKRRRMLQSTECLSREFVSVAFSSDSRVLVAQGGAPDWTIVIWSWEKSKQLGFLKMAANPSNTCVHVACAMVDANSVSVVGNGILKQIKILESGLKLLPSAIGKREPQNYTAQAWTSDDRLIVGTDHGDILIVEGSELKSNLGKAQTELSCVESLCVYSKGFVVGSDEGVITLFEKTDDRDLYKRTRSFRNESNSFKVRSMALSPSEDALVIALDNSQLFTFLLSNADISKSTDLRFEHMISSFHYGQVTGMEPAIRKPLLATCGLDKNIRIWNYVDRTLELFKHFNEEAQCISFHPSGLHLLVGFSDKLRMLNVLMNDIRPFKEFSIKACKEARFSNGGHLFAAVNGNTINIFSTYTCENIGNLRGHNGKVRSMCWSADDSKMVSCGVDGAVYEWSMKDFKRAGEHVLKACNYSAVTCTPDGKNMFAVGSDKKIKEIMDSNVIKDPESDCLLTCIVLSSSGRMLFAGTESGSVRSYKYPLTGEFQEYQCCSRPVSRICMSIDEALLFVSGDDGAVVIFDVRDKEVRVAKRDRELLPFAEEILVTKTDLEEQVAIRNDLKQKVDELTLQNEYQLRLKEMNHQEKLKELTEKFTIEVDCEKARYDMLQQEKNDLEIEFEEKIRTLEDRNRSTLANLETQYQQKMMGEVERYQLLQEEKELINERWDEQNSLLVENHERLVQELTDEYEYKLQEEQLALQRVKEEKEELLRELEETRSQVEDDADKEIEELKEKYEQRLQVEKEACLRLKGENGIMRKKFDTMKKEIDERADNIKQLYEKEKELYAQIQLLGKEITGLKKEIRERDETIGDKEKRIYDLKKKNQELEKFKFVLDYKIKELKKQIEPREIEIGNMKEQIKDMDGELERYHKQTSQLQLKISDQTLRVEGQQKEILSQRLHQGELEAQMKRFRVDLHECVQFIQDPKNLKDAVKKLHAKYVGEVARKAEVDTDIQQEYNRQRDYLEKTVEGLKRKLSKDMELHKNESSRIMGENVELIKEINDLRRENRSLKSTQGRDEPSRGNSQELLRELEMQRDEIRRLRDRIEMLEGSGVMNRPVSRERLPPLDGFQGENVVIGTAK